MRKAFIQIFHHDIGFIQYQVTIYQRWQAVIRVKISQIFWFVMDIYIHHINSDTFFRQYNTHTMAVLAGSVRVKKHRRAFSNNSHISRLKKLTKEFMPYQNVKPGNLSNVLVLLLNQCVSTVKLRPID